MSKVVLGATIFSFFKHEIVGSHSFIHPLSPNLPQMAKAVANATTAAFITMVGSEFVQKYLGEGPRMVRDVFRLARENSPAIVFIDEIGKFGVLLFLAVCPVRLMDGIFLFCSDVSSYSAPFKVYLQMTIDAHLLPIIN